MTRLKSAALLLTVFFAGGLTSSVFEWLDEITSVEITNSSHKTIKHLDITYSGLGDHHGRLANSFGPGEVVVFKWATIGEARYQLHAVFDDGTEVRGGRGYIVRGDVVKEAIRPTSVISRMPVMLSLGLLHHDPRDTTLRVETSGAMSN